MTEFVIAGGIGFVASVVGSMVGIGGGVIIVPSLTLLMGYDIKDAIFASLMSIVSTSTMATAIYTLKGWVHQTLGYVLVVGSLTGAFLGSHIAVQTPSGTLYLLFAVFLFVPTYFLMRPGQTTDEVVTPTEAQSGRWLLGEFRETMDQSPVRYVIQQPALQIAATAVAGLFGGLLGVGGGLVNVPVMTKIGKIPFKAAAATSTLVIGFTALMGSVVFFFSGSIRMDLPAHVVVGSLIGAMIGPKLSSRIHSRWLNWIFITLLLVSSIRMMIQAYRLP